MVSPFWVALECDRALHIHYRPTETRTSGCFFLIAWTVRLELEVVLVLQRGTAVRQSSGSC